MAKNKKRIRETTIENYYDLKIDKMNELVAALKDETPPEDKNDLSMFISDCTGENGPETYTRTGKKKQFDPYKTDFLARIPIWIKALFVKWWFAAVVCYFVMMGLQTLMNAPAENLVLITGVVLGLVTEMLVNPAFRYMERDGGEYDPYMMFPFPFKAYWTFFTNVIYYIIIAFCINFCYLGLNELINFINHTAGAIPVGVEPLLYGTFCVIVDMFFIGVKNLIVYLVKRKKKEKTANV